LKDGSALKRFNEFCSTQGGKLSLMKQSAKKYEVLSPSSGFVTGFDTEKIGLAALSLGAGRVKVTDQVDHSAGIRMHAKISEPIEKDKVLFTLYGENENLFEAAKQTLLAATNISLQNTKSPSLIALRI
jgi:pyrimidine-nucleoside phosphorylase